MSEERSIYTIVEMAATVKTDQEDTAYQHLAERVATHYRTLVAGGMGRKAALRLTDEFQDFLLCCVGLPESETTMLRLEGE